MKKLLLFSLVIGAAMFFTSSAVGNFVPVTLVEYGAQDGISLQPGTYDECGDAPPFPIGEQVISSWVSTSETACTGFPYDDPLKPNVLVTITDINYSAACPAHGNLSRELWYVADPETSLTNYDMFVNGCLAFKIDNLGINKPLVSESLIVNNRLDPGETIQFIIQDFTNSLGGSPAPFDSLGIAGVSSGWPPSTGSIIPEPATIGLLVIGGLAILRRRHG